ncbi:zinc finger BED domain-containing protein RICESLEEPER [Trifolium repens]|nr:zinc finger BED domain-containing protein RICESLEEPER [Trifolium repens]
MSSSTSIESFEGSLPNDGEECLNIVNSTIDLDANTNEGAFTNEVTPANEVGNEENVENNDIVIQKAKRKKTSLVWEHFKEVELKNGTKKWQCLHCKRNYAIVASGSTSHLKRHLNEVCLVYKKLVAQQKKLNLQPSKSMVDEKLSGPLLMNPSGKYDHER